MGVLSDLVIAARGDEAKILQASAPSKVFDGIEVRGIQDLELVMLHEVMIGEPIELEQTFEDSEGPWVFSLPNRFTAALAGLTAAAQRDVSKRWALHPDGGPDGPLDDLVGEICELACKAVASQRELFL
jgi:hypothetical protein